jgi:iron complex outermembrane receptor protein
MALALGMGTSALAADQKASTLDEVVVTARRVAENVQTVPVSITALSSEVLSERSVLNLGDIQRLTPGLFYTNLGANQTQPTLRGAGTYAAGDAVRPVVTYFAEVPLHGASGLAPLFDLSNVQVLKGPQGTLFGRNAYAGAVLITPRAPSFDFGGYAKLSAGNYDYNAAEAGVDIPIVDEKVALRLAGLYQRRDGYIKNISGPDGYELNENNFRASLLIQPTENFRITEIYDYRFTSGAGATSVNLGISPTIIATARGLAPALYNCASGNPSCNILAAIQQAASLGPYGANFGVIKPLEKIRAWGSTTKAEYTIGDVNLVNILGFRKHSGSSRSEVDGLGLSVPLFHAFSYDKAEQLSEEFHADGHSFDGKLNWIAGFFYAHVKQNSVGGLTLLEGIRPPGPETASLIYRTNITKAVFGQVTWDFSDQVKGLSLDLGARYNWDEKSSCFRLVPAPGFVPPLDVNPNTLAGRGDCGTILQKTTYKGEAPTWNIALNYQATDGVFLYVTARRGYREGSLNIPDLSQTILRNFQSAGPEKVTDVEVGLKSDWRMGEVVGRLNLSAYHGWYKGVQVGISTAPLQNFCPPVSPPGNPLCLPPAQQPNGNSVNVNVGSQEVSGAEMQLEVRPTADLTLTAGVAYTHLDKTDFTVPSFATAPVVSIFSPEWTANATLRYRLPFQPLDPDSSLTFLAAYSYSDSILIRGTRRTPSWDQTDLRLDWKDVGGEGLTISAFVTNVFDQTNAIVVSGGAGIDSASYNAPRMYGVEVKLDF